MERSPPVASRPPRSRGVDGARRGLLIALPGAFFALALALGGCGKDAPPKDPPTVNTDLTALQRLIKLPANVQRAEWQTGPLAEHGGDWWVAAVLDVPAGGMSPFLAGPASAGTLDTPPGMLTTSSFAALKALPGAEPVADGRLRLAGDVHGIEPYASSPLLHGSALQLSPTQVFVLLWTN